MEFLAKGLRLLKDKAVEATGKTLTASDYEALYKIIKHVVEETDAARARSPKPVTSYLPFAAAVIKNRLTAEPKGKPVKQKKPFEPGREESPIDDAEFVPDPLDEKARKTVLRTLREMLEREGREALETKSDFYTAEDWNWLMKELEGDE
jgi:hypothetical protein